MRRILSLVFVASLIGACSNTTPTGTPSTSTSPTASQPSKGGRTADPSDVPTTEPSSPQTPTPGAGGKGTPGPTARAVPPASGLYRYRQSGQTTYGFFTFEPDAEGTLRVDAAEGARQRQLRTYSDARSQESFFLYRGDRVLLQESTSYVAGQEQGCRTDDPIVAVELPLRVGASWSDAGECDGLTISLRAEVTKTAARTVGGEDVSTFVVSYVVDVRGDGIRQTTRSTSWLSPQYRLIVRTVSRTTGTVEGSEFSDELTEDLLSVTPE